MTLKLLFSIITLILNTSVLYALDQEMIVQNGLDPIASALKRIALIFSDDNYLGLFGAVTLLSLFTSGVKGAIEQLKTSRFSLLEVLLPTIVGVALFGGIITSKGTLIVYDSVQNRQEIIPGIPDGLILLVSGLNQVEQAIQSIVDQSSLKHLSYEKYAGGVGFDLLKKATHSENLRPPDRYIDSSMGSYIQDCLFFELQRPGTKLTSTEITSGSYDMISSFQKAASPAIHTVVYNEDKPTGYTLTCEESFKYLKAYLNSDLMHISLLANVCAAAYPSRKEDVQMYVGCQEALEDHANYLLFADTTGGSRNRIQSETFLTQSYLSWKIHQMLYNDSSDDALRGLGNRSSMNSFLGMGLMANEWLPTMRYVFYGTVLSITPFLALFISSMLIWNALSLIGGFLLWLSVWGIADMVLHDFAIEYAYHAFEKIRQTGLGYFSIMTMPEHSEKALALFGLIRTSSITLATFITAKLFGFGGYAFTSMTGEVTGSVQSAAAGATRATQTEAISETSNQLLEPVAMYGTYPKEYFMSAAASKAANQRSEYGRGLRLAEGTLDKAQDYGYQSQAISEAQVSGKIEGAGGHSGVNKAFQKLQETEVTQTQQSIGSAQGVSHAATTLGTGVESVSTQNSYVDTLQGFSNNAVIGEMAGSLAKEHGLDASEAYMELAKFRMADTDAKTSAFGTAEEYAQFLENQQDISVGSVEALIDTAHSQGHSARNFSYLNQYSSKMKEAGAVQALEQGKVTPQDFEQVGKIHSMDEASRAREMFQLKDTMGYDDIGGLYSDLNKVESMGRVARMATFMDFAEKQKFDPMELAQSQNSVTHPMYVNKDWAQKLDLPGQGSYVFQLQDGNIEGFQATAGKRYSDFDLRESKSGTDVSHVDTDTFTHDHSSNYGKALQAIMKGDDSVFDRLEEVVQTGDTQAIYGEVFELSKAISAGFEGVVSSKHVENEYRSESVGGNLHGGIKFGKILTGGGEINASTSEQQSSQESISTNNIFRHIHESLLEHIQTPSIQDFSSEQFLEISQDAIAETLHTQQKNDRGFIDRLKDLPSKLEGVELLEESFESFKNQSSSKFRDLIVK